MIFNYISSVQCVFEVIDSFGIKSEDFVTRAPLWISNCLKDLGLRENVVTKHYESRFNNNRCLLPIFCQTIDWVVIDGHRADYNDSLYNLDSEVELNRESSFIGDPTAYFGESPLISIDSNEEIDTEFINTGMPYFYRLENGWLHTNVRFGTIEIKYKGLQTVLDSTLGIEFPTIPDEFNTKEAIKMFILKTLLMRGYIHPILNLKENNPITNPGISYEKFKGVARLETGRPNIDARQKWSYPLAPLVGIRKPLYIDRSKNVTTEILNPNALSDQITEITTTIQTLINQYFIDHPITINQEEINNIIDQYFIDNPLETNNNTQSGILINVSSKNVSQSFSPSFMNIPVVSKLQVYRYGEPFEGAGYVNRLDVVYHFENSDWLTINGFSLVIDTDENLSGVIVEYYFSERTN